MAIASWPDTTETCIVWQNKQLSSKCLVLAEFLLSGVSEVSSNVNNNICPVETEVDRMPGTDQSGVNEGLFS